MRQAVADRTGWTISADGQQPGNEATNVIDGNRATLWHTPYYPSTTRYPHFIAIDTKKLQLLQGLKYLPRQDGGTNGTIGQYIIEVSSDNVIWTVVTSGSWANDLTEKTATFDTTLSRYVRLTAQSESQNGGNPWASCAELNLLCDPSPARILAALQAEQARLTIDRSAADAAALSKKVSDLSISLAANIIGYVDAASYGPADVTNIVRNAYNLYMERNPDTTVPFVMNVDNGTMGGDSWPMHVKMLTVIFRTRTRDSSPTDIVTTRTITAFEGAPITLDLRTPPPSIVEGIVDSATYGPRDVTSLISNAYTSYVAKITRTPTPTLPFTMTIDNGSMGGDSWPMHVKTLTLAFYFRNRDAPPGTAVNKRTIAVGEGGTLSLDVRPPSGDPSIPLTAEAQTKARLDAFNASSAMKKAEIIQATYSPTDVTQLLRDSWRQYNGGILPWSLVVSNESMGGDSWPWHVKQLNVLMRFWREGDGVNTSVYQVFLITEGNTLNVT